MKKIYFSLFVGLIFFSGCSSKQQQLKQQGQCVIDSQNAPIWVCEPKDTKDFITAVGSAEKSPLGFSFQRTEAMANARDALARRISIKVKNIFKRFERNTGVKAQSEKVVENVSKQLADVTLRNSKIISTWQSKNGTLFVLVGVPKKNLEEGLKDSPAFQQYQKNSANKAWKELDKEIKAEFGE
ncbi:LPP20 family lipoprotein [Caminibacter sp.]